tara:strand:+ start:326 stop:508 length:183 start_codon:yes stop_codon:yes gene_type:complete
MTETLKLSKDQSDCVVEWCKDFLYDLPSDRYKNIEEYPAFQILQKLRPDHLLSQINSWKE